MEVAGTGTENCSFWQKNGLYELQTMLFALYNAVATFQRLMQTALVGLLPKHCIIHLDDILVFDREKNEHTVNLKLVLDHLRNATLTLTREN